MSKSEFVDFKAVKAAVSIEQILDHYALLEKLRRSGDSLTGPCPIHQGDNKTQFRVSLSKNCWNCFGKCKAGGNILDFVSRMENVSIRQAALLIQDWFSVQSPQQPAREKRKPAPKKKAEPKESPDATENKPLGFELKHLDPAHPYLKERGLTEETIATFGLGFCPKGILAGQIAIPIHNAAGQLVAYAGRYPGDPPDDQPKYKLPKGFWKSLEVFNLHRTVSADPEQPLIIVEGFFGCIKLWQAGLRRTVALMGSSLSEAQADLIRRHIDSQSRIILLFDDDDAGRAGREHAAPLLARFAYVRIIEPPQEGQQVDSLSPEELHFLLEGQPAADTAESRPDSSPPAPAQVAVRTYEGHRGTAGQLTVTVNDQVLDPRFDLRNHSPNGFAWGYGGNGPAQLALAILADHFGDDKQALAHYQDFKWKVVTGLPRDGWSLTRDQIQEALASLEQPEPSAP